MGTRCGCFPIKQRPSPAAATSNDLPNPETKNTPSESIPVQETIKKSRIFIVFYSMYGHVETLARSIKKGIETIDGVEGVLFRVPETMSLDDLDQMNAVVASSGNEDRIPVISVEELVNADGFLFGFPTRFGSMAAQMKAFFDSTGQLWKEQSLAGVPAGFFVSTGTQGGGQETTAWTAITQLVHHGMIYVPVGYTFGAGMFKMDSIRGGSPYGAGILSGDGTREPDETELALAEHQGKNMAAIVKRISRTS